MELHAKWEIDVLEEKHDVIYQNGRHMHCFFKKLNLTVGYMRINWIEYFIVWIQICMIFYICNEMHKTFLQLELVA
jgi:hypothetical protein